MWLLLQDCQSKIQCAGCLKPFARSEWTPKQLENANAKDRTTKLVCKSCVAEGCTAYDPKFYTCKVCNKKKGCKRFNINQLENHNYHNRPKLECLDCHRENVDRERLLHKKFKQSKWFFTCGNPIHNEKCPLATMFYGKRRWPGGDGFITAEENAFLSNLNPRPTWWARALRKPNKPKWTVSCSEWDAHVESCQSRFAEPWSTFLSTVLT